MFYQEIQWHVDVSVTCVWCISDLLNDFLIHQQKHAGNVVAYNPVSSKLGTQFSTDADTITTSWYQPTEILSPSGKDNVMAVMAM